MQRCFFVIWGLFLVQGLFAQGNALTPEQLKKKMSDIRKSTNWDDADAAKRANDSIKVLSGQLMKIYQQQNAPADETPEQKAMREANEAYKQKLMNQIIESASQGENADILLGEPARMEIDEFIRLEAEQQKNKSPEYFEQMNFLCLDMSSPEVQAVIGQMDKFQNITTMLVMGGEHRAPVDLDLVFRKAANYPLQQLYIINFPLYVKKFPEQVTNYPDLEFLSLVNNGIPVIPASIKSMKKLKTLYVDLNPVPTIIGSISGMGQLEKLGIEQTKISAQERADIEKLLPDCIIERP